MGQMKTPGVYIVEKSAFPNSVVEVATAVPAFIGYTEVADNKGNSLTGKPWRISSMAEYHTYFGGAPTPLFTITEAADDPEGFPLKGVNHKFEQTKGKFLLYYGMLQFFQNGGGPCFVVSMGDYESTETVSAEDLQKGIDSLAKEQEPTMVVCPDAVLLGKNECYGVQKKALAHCGDEKMRNRVAILDVWDGYRERTDPAGDCVADFRNNLGTSFLDFGAAYYPWVNCTIITASDLGHENIDSDEVLKKLLTADVNPPIPAGENEGETKAEEEKRKEEETKRDERQKEIDKIGTLKTDPAAAAAVAAETIVNRALLNKTLVAMSPLFSTILGEIKNRLNLLPPSAAMAGVYTLVDNTRGVWKAPANVSLNGVVSPALKITHADQEDLNVTPQGKSINAIRDFIGEGTLVWGARTLDGNSLDWRYINVRRTMIMLEQSIKLASKASVFEKNDANTWVTMKSMIGNFLTGIWKRGGLAGASPDDAFSVHVGLGETMTPEDILEGILRITVLVAISRPAEFIEITFQQQMQKS